MKKILVLLATIVLLVTILQVEVESEHYEDGSGRATISYCLPLTECSK